MMIKVRSLFKYREEVKPVGVQTDFCGEGVRRKSAKKIVGNSRYSLYGSSVFGKEGGGKSLN